MAASWIVLAFLLSRLWLLLRSVSREAPFTDQIVRRLRVIGGALVGWKLLEPLLWLFLSPQGLRLGSMEPGRPQLTWLAFGALLLLLAQVFRRGVRLEQDQRLTA